MNSPAPCLVTAFSLLAAAVSGEQLREGSALSNRDLDSTTAGVCVTVRRGLRTAVRSLRGPVSYRALVCRCGSKHRAHHALLVAAVVAAHDVMGHLRHRGKAWARLSAGPKLKTKPCDGWRARECLPAKSRGGWAAVHRRLELGPPSWAFPSQRARPVARP